MTDAELEEWREHPVTRVVLASLGRCLELEEASLTRDYLSGAAVANPQRLEVARMGWVRNRELVADLSEASAEDFISMMEREQ